MSGPPISRSKAIKALKALSRFQATHGEIMALASEKIQAIDRANAIYAVARIDTVLAHAITKRFVDHSPDELDTLFFDDGPLQSFAAKIKLGYTLKLYGTVTKADLNIMKEIRNTFAHSVKPIDFSTPAIAQCYELLVIAQKIKYPAPVQPAIRFSMAVNWTSVNILEFAYGGDQSLVP